MSARMYRALAILGLAVVAMSSDAVQRGTAATLAAPVRTIGTPVVPIAVTAPPAPAPLPVAGWVIDGDGTPIPDVAIAVAGIVVATSEADGAFRIADLHAGDRLALDAPHVFPAEVVWRDGPPPKILLARRIAITARVLAGVGGEPVAGATVYLSDGSGPAVATAVTADDGTADFADLMPGPYELWADHGRTASPLVRQTFDGDGEHAVELALAPAGAIHGVIDAADGVPANARVQLVPVDLDHAARVAVVDDSGTFLADGIPPGQWRIEVDAPAYVPDTATIVDVVAAPQPIEAVVTLRRAGAVTGTVVDDTGAPVAGATIVLRAQGLQAIAARPEPLAPSRALRWVHPLAVGAAGERQMPIRDSRVFGAVRQGSRPAECGKGHCGVDLGTRKGEVVHAAADGVLVCVFFEIRHEAGRYVAIQHAGGLTTFYMHLDTVRPDLEVGQHIRAGDPVGTVGTTGFARPNPHLHFALAQDRAGRRFYIDPVPMLQHAVVLPQPRALAAYTQGATPTVVAAVRWSDVRAASGGGGGTIQGAIASATATATSPAPAGGLEVAAMAAPTTDAAGAFHIDGVAPGSYVAAAFAPDLAPGTSAAFSVTTGADTGGIVIRLAPGVVVRGRILGRDGPVAGAQVTAEEGTGETAHQIASVYADRYGEYVLRALSGHVTLAVIAPGYGRVERAIDLAPATARGIERREDFDLVVEDSWLRGRVLGPDGAPAAGVSIITVDGPSQRRTAVTGPDGGFAIERVARGDYAVELTSADSPVTRRTITAEAWTDLTLDRGGAVAIDLRDTHTGAALAGVGIDATGPDGRSAEATTDAAGIATLRGLAPGAWTVRVRAAGYVSVERSLDIRAADRPDDVRIELGRGATLAGIVRDRYGDRVAGARVWLGPVSARTDRDGNFRLIDVPTGPGQLRAEKDSLHGAIDVDLAPGDEQVTLSIDVAE